MRSPANSYLAAMFVGSFFCALLFYLGFYPFAAVLFLISSVVIPICALTDRIVFDGKRLYRVGVLPKAWAYISSSRFWVKLKDIEQVETVATPSIRRGGRVYFRYRTWVRGKGIELSSSSRSREYRRLFQALFRALPDEVLDATSLELRDYMGEPRAARERAERSAIPSADVLDQASRRPRMRKWNANPDGLSLESSDKAASLRVLGNELRFSGSLLQALESFRRAASIRPNDPWLLFEFARCIHAFAGAERDPRLKKQAAAMMRLAERRAGGDGQLLARVGEGYFQLGEPRRAAAAFRKAIESVGEQFRSIRGMAEVALREGKLAHVVHNFAAASRLAQSPAARRWSLAEAEYFSRLNNDGEYLDLEIGRVNLLESLARWRRTTLKLVMIGLPIIALGLYFDDVTTTNAGWTLSAGTLVVWVLISLGMRMFSSRISPELLGED